ncbi:hypothetical protein D9Q98_010544 [Chlorella vulgaris]|uniref:Uncharacterized protein n=1 Tax=Chlorella vulgaris TaxID=3077 RepID=A0A9D4YXE0_CHLVU|nr:hypothetical protein D9Q98_010544 [Chlorella vulgaris]
MAGRITLLLCLCLVAGAAAAPIDAATACSKMPATWKPVETVPDEVSWAVYSAAYDRYAGSGLDIDWTSYYCAEPTYSYDGCYANSTDNTRSNYMYYLNATCTAADGKEYTLGLTADASWYNATAYAYDADLEYVWGGDKAYTQDELRGVWWEKNDEYYYEDAPDTPDMPDVPATPTPDAPAANPYRRRLRA